MTLAPDRAEATRHAMHEALEHGQAQKSRALAQQVLDTYKDDPEALWTLAQTETDPQHRDSLISQTITAARLGTSYLDPQVLHPIYLAALTERAVPNWKRGDYPSALADAEEAYRFAKENLQGTLREVLPGWLLTAGRDEEAWEILVRSGYSEWSPLWTATRALIAFRNGGDTPESRGWLLHALQSETAWWTSLLEHRDELPSLALGVAWEFLSGALHWLQDALSDPEGWKETSIPPSPEADRICLKLLTQGEAAGGLRSYRTTAALIRQKILLSPRKASGPWTLAKEASGWARLVPPPDTPAQHWTHEVRGPTGAVEALAEILNDPEKQGERLHLVRPNLGLNPTDATLDTYLLLHETWESDHQGAAFAASARFATEVTQAGGILLSLHPYEQYADLVAVLTIRQAIHILKQRGSSPTILHHWMQRAGYGLDPENTAERLWREEEGDTTENPLTPSQPTKQANPTGTSPQGLPQVASPRTFILPAYEN